MPRRRPGGRFRPREADRPPAGGRLPAITFPFAKAATIAFHYSKAAN